MKCSGDTAPERDTVAVQDLETDERSEIEIGKGRHAYARSVSQRGRESSRITWRPPKINPKLNWTFHYFNNSPKAAKS